MREVEEEQETIQLKKIPSVPPKEAGEEDKPQKVIKTTVFDVEEMVHKTEAVEISVATRKPMEERKPREKADAVQKPEVISAKEETQKAVPKDAWERQKPPPKDEKPEDTISLKKTPRTPKEDEPASPAAVLKKVKKLPLDEVEPEVIKLKPFEKPAKPAEEPERVKKERPVKDPMSSQKQERMPREVEPKEPPKKPEKASPEVTESPARRPEPADKKKPPEKEPEEVKVPTKVKKLPTQEQERESVKLKPFSRPPKEAAESEKTTVAQEKKPTDELHRHRVGPEDKAKVHEPEVPLKRPGIPEAPQRKLEKEKDAEAVPVEKRATSMPDSVKEPEKVSEEPKPFQLKKGVTPKTKEEKEDVALQPVEHLKQVALKKTPSPKVGKLKEAEVTPVEKRLKMSPKPLSPKDSNETVTLKKLPKKPSAEEGKAAEPVEPDKGKVPLVKEVSPRAVQLRKVATQPEEEVFEEEFKADEEAEQEEEEAWGWELVPRESYDSEDWEGEQEGALEVPGVTRRGELVAPFRIISTRFHRHSSL